MITSQGTDFDILIAGMGVAGSILAYNLAKNGYKVLGIEKGNERFIRTVWTNEVPIFALKNHLLNSVEIPTSFTPEITAIKGRDNETAFYIDSRQFVESVNTEQFVINLRNASTSLGATILYQTKISNIRLFKDYLSLELISGTKKREVKTSYLIDCTGVDSELRSNFFKNEINDSDFILAYRYTYKVDAKNIKRFWNKHKIATGSALLRLSENGGFNTVGIYPNLNKESVDILIGGSDVNIRDRLKEIREIEFGGKSRPISGGGGKIPIRRPFMILFRDRVFRIGDSASMTYPMCASGVATIISASEMLIEAIKCDKPNLFQERFNMLISSKYSMMTFLRKVIEESDRNDIDLLFDIFINPISLRYVFSNQSVINLENLILSIRNGIKLFKRPRIIKKALIYLLAGGLDSVLYSLKPVFTDTEYLSFIESRLVKAILR